MEYCLALADLSPWGRSLFYPDKQINWWALVCLTFAVDDTRCTCRPRSKHWLFRALPCPIIPFLSNFWLKAKENYTTKSIRRQSRWRCCNHQTHMLICLLLFCACVVSIFITSILNRLVSTHEVNHMHTTPRWKLYLYAISSQFDPRLDLV
jgi:hypothetical protein